MEFINLKQQYLEMKPEIQCKIEEILSQAQFINGKEVKQFEEELANYVGRNYCISCGNGTDALQLVYMAYGIGKGHAVFCPDMTFIASIEPACMLGATPIFCDIERDTYNLSPESLEIQIKEVITEGKLMPRAVVAVDFLGNPANYREIEQICKKYNLLLIEDAAQSIGAEAGGRKCGSFGDISCTSFFPSKPLGCYGDGGAVFTDDARIATMLESLKVHGKGKDKYDNVRIGINSRLDTLQAGILLVKLKHLDDEMKKRQEVARAYDEAFHGRIQTPAIEKDRISSFAQYCLLAKDEEEREKIVKNMKKNNIPSLVYYPNPLHTLKAFKYNRNCNFPNSESYAARNFGVPFSPYLKKEEQEKVIYTILNSLD